MTQFMEIDSKSDASEMLKPNKEEAFVNKYVKEGVERLEPDERSENANVDVPHHLDRTPETSRNNHF